VKTKDELQAIHDKYFNILKDAGISGIKAIQIRNAFTEFGKSLPKNINQKGEHFYSEYSDLKHFYFNSEKEVNLINALYEMNPAIHTETIIDVFKIVCKLLDVETEWNFTRKVK